MKGEHCAERVGLIMSVTVLQRDDMAIVAVVDALGANETRTP